MCANRGKWELFSPALFVKLEVVMLKNGKPTHTVAHLARPGERRGLAARSLKVC